MIYIREAHPADGWVAAQNQQQGIAIADPKSLDKRAEVASTCSLKLHLSWPILVDGMDDAVNKAYAAWPDRFYVISKDGKVVLKGEQGPKGFKADELESFLQKTLGR